MNEAMFQEHLSLQDWYDIEVGLNQGEIISSIAKKIVKILPRVQRKFADTDRWWGFYTYL